MVRRQWLDDRSYADLVALCQFLPGPASSQVGVALGIARAGYLGGLASWLGFTLPSALMLMAFGYGLAEFGDITGSGWIHGLKVVAVAVVAQAIWGMARSLCPDRERASLAVLAALLVIAWPTSAGQIAAIGAGALIGWKLLKTDPAGAHTPLAFPITRRAALTALALFFALLIGLPLLALSLRHQGLQMFDAFYRTGSLVFGGGHVILPLLRLEVVPTGWVSDSQFLAGYGAAQAIPGPLFTFAAYLGVVSAGSPSGWQAGLLCVVAIFLPAFLLVVGALPFWESLRRRPAVQQVMRGVNAAVVGLLIAALYNPLWIGTISGPGDFALALAAFALLTFWKVPPLPVVLATAAGGGLLAAFA